LVSFAGIIISLSLAAIAWRIPIGEPLIISFDLFSFSINIDESFILFGRQFILDNDFRPIITMIYFGLAFWFGGSLTTSVDNMFVPIGLLLTALLTAVIAVEPFLYAALLIEIAALVSVIILSPPGTLKHRGTLRFVTFVTLGMPLVLVAGWLLTGIGTNPEDVSLILRVTALVGLGLALFMGIFPFHSWIPILTEETNPYSTGFVIVIIPQAVSFFLLSYLSRFTWFSAESTVYETLRIMGIFMVVFGGVWSAFQTHLGRIMSFAVIMEIGFSLLAISLLDPSLNGIANENLPVNNLTNTNLSVFYYQFLPRLIGFAVWSLSLVMIKSKQGSLSFNKIKGLFYNLPFASIGVIVATFSIAGLPIFATFPVRIVLWSSILRQSLPIALLITVGVGGLFIAGFRILAQIIRSEDKFIHIHEERIQIILLIIGWFILILLGLVPQTIFIAFTQI